MSETARKLFDGLRAMREAARQTGSEMSRLGTQGAMELASALFNGQGFVPYGPGQYTPSVDHDQQQQQSQGIER